MTATDTRQIGTEVRRALSLAGLPTMDSEFWTAAGEQTMPMHRLRDPLIRAVRALSRRAAGPGGLVILSEEEIEALEG